MSNLDETPVPETNAVTVRARLLEDPYNVRLRKLYLALRTPDLLEEDRGFVRTHRDALQAILPGILFGVVIGIVVWGVSWCIVALGVTVPDNPTQRHARIIGILRMFANQFGLLVSVTAFSLTTGLFAWSSALDAKKRSPIAAELGPLPPDAPDTLAKAREVLLQEST